MKLSTIVVLSIAAVAFMVGIAGCSRSSPPTGSASGHAVAYYTCSMHPSVKADKPGACPICGMALQPVYSGGAVTNQVTPSTTNNTIPSAANATPYPLDTCVVDGMQLGSMGAPYVFVYQGQEIKLCCANCQPDFLREPAKYMKKIQDAEASR